jgi:Fe2+ transport system protein FeoA
MTTLDALRPGQWATITTLRCAEAARLDRLGGYGLVPGSLIRLRQVHPAFILEIGETVLSLDREVARDIAVQLQAA